MTFSLGGGDIKYLSLFSGACGGDLGLQWLLGWKCLGYVEWEDYCCDLIEQRKKDGFLDNAPLFRGDIREFIRQGYAESYKGMVDVVTGGFPCQPFSVAGKRKGESDERNMFPATVNTLCLVRPRYAYLENVPGLLVARTDEEGRRHASYYGRILGDLAESGYDVIWKVLSAAEVGTPHKRDRIWIVAYNNMQRCNAIEIQTGKHFVRNNIPKNNELHTRTHATNDWLVRNSFVCGKPNDVTEWMDRYKALGNAQIPLVAATAWNILTGGEVG